MLNSEQIILAEKLKEFIKNKDFGFYGVLGAGGTGKTYTICSIIENPKDFIFLGATNKVVSVLKKGLEQNGIDLHNTKCQTIDSFLSFKMKKDHNNVTVISHRLPKIDTIPKVIVIDEISLINNNSFEMLMKLKDKRKFILIGDNRQIPPIELDGSLGEYPRDIDGFKVSPIFNNLDWRYILTIQQRQISGSGLFDLVMNFREHMTKRFNYEKMAFSKCNGVDILCYDINSKELKNLIYGENPIAVCYKNLTALTFAWVIGSTKSNNKGYKVNELNVGDTVFFDSFYKYENDKFYTSELVKITEIESYIEESIDVGDIKPAYFNYKKLMVQREDGGFVILRSGNGYKETLYPVKYRFDRVINELKRKATESKNIKQKWVYLTQAAELNTKYNDFKTSFAKLKKPFAITAHKSQGSTFDDVIVPIYDFGSKIPHDAAQLLYVAMSRAKKRIIFVTRQSNFKDNSERYKFTELERYAIASSQEYQCNICLTEINDSRLFDIDHRKPLANCGTNSLDNLQALCKECHQEKTKKEKYEKPD
jgi:exodeoxyribonuclease-5